MTLNFNNFQAVQHHYGDPSKGCMSGEVAGQIQGVSNHDVCMPMVDSTGACSTDLPTGATARAQAAAQDAQGNKYCILICKMPFFNGTCGAGADCVSPGQNAFGTNFQVAVGLCMYPTSAAPRFMMDN